MALNDSVSRYASSKIPPVAGTHSSAHSSFVKCPSARNKLFKLTKHGSWSKLSSIKSNWNISINKSINIWMASPRNGVYNPCKRSSVHPINVPNQRIRIFADLCFKTEWRNCAIRRSRAIVPYICTKKSRADCANDTRGFNLLTRIVSARAFFSKMAPIVSITFVFVNNEPRKLGFRFFNFLTSFSALTFASSSRSLLSASAANACCVLTWSSSCWAFSLAWLFEFKMFCLEVSMARAAFPLSSTTLFSICKRNACSWLAFSFMAIFSVFAFAASLNARASDSSANAAVSLADSDFFLSLSNAEAWSSFTWLASSSLALITAACFVFNIFASSSAILSNSTRCFSASSLADNAALVTDNAAVSASFLATDWRLVWARCSSNSTVNLAVTSFCWLLASIRHCL